MFVIIIGNEISFERVGINGKCKKICKRIFLLIFWSIIISSIIAILSTAMIERNKRQIHTTVSNNTIENTQENRQIEEDIKKLKEQNTQLKKEIAEIKDGGTTRVYTWYTDSKGFTHRSYYDIEKPKKKDDVDNEEANDNGKVIIYNR